MYPVPDAFEFDYRGTDVLYGRGRLRELGSELDDRGYGRALIVCGSNVGANDALMDPLRDGLGDRLAGVFDGTTPAKSVETVYEAIEAVREADADVLVAVGGGSSLDVARQTSVLAADGRSLAELRAAAREGALEAPDPDEPAAPVVVVPTTFAGADLSSGGSVEVLPPAESPTDQPVRVSGSVAPTAAVYDPDAFETTPAGALAGSAMNGFDKGIETIYARDADPRSDATAVHGLRLLRGSLPRLIDDDPDPGATERAVAGLILVQLDRKLSIVHAFGHGFARRYPVQQGVVHAVVVPHVLRYLLDRVDARRALLAAGLGVGDAPGDGGDGRSDAAAAERIVGRVIEVRDGLGLPTRLRALSGTDEDDLPAVAEFVVDDSPMRRAPAGLDPTVEDIEAVLREAW